MLKVPELKPGQIPYDPAIHTLTRANPPENEVLSPSAVGNGGDEPAGPDEILDHALVKDAVTALHREDDEHFARLRDYDALQLCEMEKEHRDFLANQKAKYENQFRRSEQKRLFLAMTENYFTWSLERAGHLRRQKIDQYRREVVERQNAEFLERALRPENVFDDGLQTAYRDMILFNLDNLLDALPAGEKRERLDEANRVFLRKVLDKRLELDPASLSSVLDSPTARHSLSRSEIDRYTRSAAAAVRRDALSRQAAEWVNRGVTPEEAERRIGASSRSPEAREELLELYRRQKYNFDRKKCLTVLLNVMNVGNLVRDGGGGPEAIPDWVVRVDTELRDHVLRELSARECSGGLPLEVDYGELLRFVDGYEPREIMSRFADAGELYGFVEKMGGAGSEPFGVVLRLLLGALTEEDERWLAGMRLCRDHLETNGGDVKDSNFYRRFDIIRRLRETNAGGKPQDELQLRQILTEL